MASSSEKVVSGGATAFPQLQPRPEPMCHKKVILRALLANVRGPLLAAVAVQALEPLYRRIVRHLVMKKGYSERTVFSLATVLVHATVYCGANTVLYLLEKFHLLQEYRFERRKAQQPSQALINKTLLEAASKMALQFPLIYLFGFRTFKKFGMPNLLAPLPGFPTLLKHLICANVCSQSLFYAAHRLFHSKMFYKRFHKQHHSYVGTIGISSEYAHPLEEALANTFPVMIGSILSGAHPLTWLTWLMWRTEETIEAHSGYCLRGTLPHRLGFTHSDAAAFHDFHHTTNRGNFGWELYDHFGRTMDSWIVAGGQTGYVSNNRVKDKSKAE